MNNSAPGSSRVANWPSDATAISQSFKTISSRGRAQAVAEAVAEYVLCTSSLSRESSPTAGGADDLSPPPTDSNAIRARADTSRHAARAAYYIVVAASSVARGSRSLYTV